MQRAGMVPGHSKCLMFTIHTLGTWSYFYFELLFTTFTYPCRALWKHVTFCFLSTTFDVQGEKAQTPAPRRRESPTNKKFGSGINIVISSSLRFYSWKKVAHLRSRKILLQPVCYSLTIKTHQCQKHQFHLNILGVICLNMFVFLVKLKIFSCGVSEGTFRLK